MANPDKSRRAKDKDNLNKLLRQLAIARKSQKPEDDIEEDLESDLPPPPTEEEIRAICARLRSDREPDE